METATIGFIGAGAMASSIIKGLAGKEKFRGENIRVINKGNRGRIESLCRFYGVIEAKSLDELVSSSKTILLAVKPKEMAEVLGTLSGLVSEGNLVVSVAAGITTESIERFLGPGVAVVRAMPNTPAQVGQGASVLCANRQATREQKASAESIFSSVGRVYWLDEKHMDSVTALSGSGPAYFYRFAQEMAEAAEKMGLDRDISEELARQTLLGTGCLLKDNDLSLEELVSQIASPNGTTEAALKVFGANGMKALVERAMGEASLRSTEISQSYSVQSTANRSLISSAKRIVVKLGSSTVTDAEGNMDQGLLRKIAGQVSKMMAQGREVVIVSSGAIAAGRKKVGKEEGRSITEKQVLAAVGQGLLMKVYEIIFEELGFAVGQVLLTKDDLANPKRSSLCRNTLDAMLKKSVVPIINENDTVAVEEIRFGDNDSLSARIAVLIGADLLILLTDTDGLYDKDPRTDSDAKLITDIKNIDASILEMAKGTQEGGVGTGGMITKVWAANIAWEHGIPTVIANGGMPDALTFIIDGQPVGTLFAGSPGFLS